MQCGFCTPGLVVAVTDLLDRDPSLDEPASARRSRATSAGAPGTRRSSTRSAWRRPRNGGLAVTRLLIDGCEVVVRWTMPAPRPRGLDPGRGRRDRGGRDRACLPPSPTSGSTAGGIALPGLVNTHHHLYQTLTRARAQERDCSAGSSSSTRSGRGSTPSGRRGGARRPGRARAVGLLDDHGPPLRLPAGAAGLLEARDRGRAQLGLRFHPSRGSMDLGEPRAGCPPTPGRGHRRCFPATEEAVGRFHDLPAGRWSGSRSRRAPRSA